MASRKIQTYQNKAKNLCTIYFVFDLDGECKISSYSANQGGSQEHISLITIMFCFILSLKQAVKITTVVIIIRS